MIEHDVDARDIERILRALGECPGQEFAGMASVVRSMVENGVDGKDIERVLCALGEHPEQELAQSSACSARFTCRSASRPEPNLPPLQAPRRRRAATVPDTRKNCLTGCNPLPEPGR
jgi:hypothetical protein